VRSKEAGLLAWIFDKPGACKRIGDMIVAASRANQCDDRLVPHGLGVLAHRFSKLMPKIMSRRGTLKSVLIS